jgi:hypothetical protein
VRDKDVLKIGGAPTFWVFPTTGTCSGHALQTLYLFLDILDILDFPVLESSVVGSTLLALGHIVTEAQSLHGLEARCSIGALLCHHMCSQLCHPAPLTQD